MPTLFCQAHDRIWQACQPRASAAGAELLAVYKGCTRDAHRMRTGKRLVHPVCIGCASLVHGVRAGGWAGLGWGVEGIKETAARVSWRRVGNEEQG